MTPKEEKEFTLIDAFNQFWQVWENSDKRTLPCIGLYFYLVKQWNASGRLNEFRHRNTKVCSELNISKPTFINGRNWLKQQGLIDFYSRGKGDPNITYEVKNIYFKEVKKLNKITSDFTSHFTSPFTHKQSKELIVVIAGEVKNFNYLKDLFEADVGLQMNWKQKGLPAENFLSGFEQWMIQNNGAEYENFSNARKHFLFWMPKYKNSENGTNSKNNGSGHKPGTSEARVDALENWSIAGGIHSGAE